MRTLQQLLLLGLAASLVGLTGCRTINAIEDHPSKNVTIIQTTDASLFSTSFRYWQCKEDATKFTCHKVCDGKDGIECHRLSFGYASNLQ